MLAAAIIAALLAEAGRDREDRSERFRRRVGFDRRRRGSRPDPVNIQLMEKLVERASWPGVVWAMGHDQLPFFDVTFQVSASLPLPQREHLVVELDAWAQRRGWHVLSVRSYAIRVRRWNQPDVPAEERIEVRLAPFYTWEAPVGRWMYHISARSAVPSILRRGLIPRPRQGLAPGARSYPPRVYVTRTNESMRRLVIENEKLVRSGSADKLVGTGEVTVLRIDAELLRPGTQFYRDPEFLGGAYTYSHVPAAALSIVEPVPLTE